MKKINLLRFLFLLLLVFLTANTTYLLAQCKEKKSITNACKPQMKPFTYDGMAYNNIQFDDKAKVIDVEFSAFAGEKYRLLFCKSNFKEKVVIKIYDKSKIESNRTPIYNSSTTDANIWSFEPTRSGNFFIEYEVPPSSTGVKKNECIVLLIGYR